MFVLQHHDMRDKHFVQGLLGRRWRRMATPHGTDENRPGYKLIFRPYRKDKDGKVIWAKAYGLKAWPIWVKVEDDKE